nr:hypothetical protein [Brevibacillus laterosporus]
MRKKISLMLLSLSVIANIVFLSVDEIKPTKNLEFFSVRANNADPGH